MCTKLTYWKLCLSLLFIVTVFSCKKTEIEEQKTTLIIKVEDDFGNAIATNDVPIYLFDDSTSFRSAWQSEDVTQNIGSQILVSSQATFEDLDPNKNYWVYIDYKKDSQARVNNFFTQNTLKNLLEDGAITTVLIKLTPYETGHVAFYSTEVANQDDLDIAVFVDGNSIGTLSTLTSDAPTSLDDPNVITYLYQEPGTHTYLAIGNNGCVWQGTFEVEAGTNEFTKVNLTGCNFGYINFWMTDASFASYGDITVVFNDDDQVGDLVVSRNTSPSNCDKNNVLQVARPPGEYTIHGYSTNQQCVWVIPVTINEGCNNSPIEFSGCN